MNRDKQIDEMAKDIEQARIKATDTTNSMNYGFGGWYAKELYNAGYRKASEIVGEIIKDLVNFADDNKKQMLINGHSIWFINADDVTEFIAELKKKFTEEMK